MLWELCGIQNGRHDLPDANRSGKMGPVPRSIHRQFPRHIPQGFSGYDVGEVSQSRRGFLATATAATTLSMTASTASARQAGYAGLADKVLSLFTPLSGDKAV